MLLKDVIEKVGSANNAGESGLSGEDVFKALKYITEKIVLISPVQYTLIIILMK